MTVLLIVVQLLTASLVQPGVRFIAPADPCCGATFQAPAYATIATGVVDTFRNTLYSGPRQLVATVKAGISFVRVAVGVVMRSFVGVMLGSKAFLRTSRRS